MVGRGDGWGKWLLPFCVYTCSPFYSQVGCLGAGVPFPKHAHTARVSQVHHHG